MSLRTRLFVWVGSLFLVAFAVSYFFEGYVTKTNLLQAEQNIKKEILKLNELKRQHFESYLRSDLSFQEAKINVLLDKVAENQALVKGFRPSVKNAEDQTWLSSALLTFSNKWIDFIQNTNQGELTSLIAIDPDKVQLALRFPISPDVALIALQKKGTRDQWEGPLIGVRMQFDRFLLHESVQNVKDDVQSRARYALFSIQDLLKLNLSDQAIQSVERQLVGSIEFPILAGQQQMDAYVEELAKNLRIAQGYLHAHERDLPPPSAPKELQAWVHAHLPGSGREDIPTEWSIEVSREKKFYGKIMNKEVVEEIITLFDRYDEIDMAMGLSTLLATGVLGHSPFNPKAPVGVARFLEREDVGKAVYTRNMFSPKPLFSIEKCERNIFPSQEDLCMDSGMEVIDVPNLGHTFFSNTMQLKNNTGQGNRVGYLTIGVDANKILQQLSLATHEVTVLVSDGRVVSVYNADGKPTQDPIWKQLPLENIMPDKSGVVRVGNEEMFFLHMEPFPSTDFHFFVFNPKEKEFALVDTLDENANKLIEHISMQMRLVSFIALAVVLIILNNIAKRMTKPITTLANATDLVAKGKFEHVKLPELKTNRKDEICTLYRTFCKMVDELRDKEKVRGVLNKVVSREIAEEILKGSIHLGGEEREVTVLFADIRQFTRLTEKMPPGEVIELLNTCMTKISHAIDEFGGVIDKYVGDEVMALFGAPVAKEDSALKAVQSALTMVQTLSDWNKERQGQGKAPIEMGFGIHTGLVVAGNMGAENRLNYTVLGSNVNLSSRICEFAKPMQVLITDGTLKSPQVSETFDVQEVPGVELKGFTEALTVYEVKGYKKRQ